MSKCRFLFALWMAKLSVPALKITHHNGTDFPGSLALKLCPDFLSHVSQPETVIAVTGTNGKTTASNMLTDILESSGKRVMSNRAGSNIASGISTTFIRNCNMTGKVTKYDIAVLEVDERSSPRVYPFIKPDYVMITNLFRDSIMRNAHPAYIADILTKYIPKETKMILNADDLISASVSPENERVYYGIDKMDTDVVDCINLIDDVRICPQCHTKLQYAYRRYHHIGKASCPNCGFHSPNANYLAQNVDIANKTMTVREGDSTYDYNLITDSAFNVYNMVTVIAMLRQLGYSHEDIQKYMQNTAITATRHSKEEVGDVRLIRQMSKEKNALAGSRAFDYISHCEGRKEMLLMMNCLGDTQHWSENTCWIYDADFEFLNDDNIVQLVCAGARCMDYKLRLLMAGVPEDRIICEYDEFKAAELLNYTPGDDLYLLYGTDSLARAYKVYDYMKELAVARSQNKEVQS